MAWEVVESKKQSAKANMAVDRALLADPTRPTLHFYGWEGPCATYGHFVRPFDHLHEGPLDLAQRPTGGGIIFHTCDLAFSITLPKSHEAYQLNPLESYQWINRRVLNAVDATLLPADPAPITEEHRNFCMAKPTIYDLIIDGRKVGGSAQRRTKEGLLHQGSLILKMPSPEILQMVRSETIRKAILELSAPLLPQNISLEEGRAALRSRLIETFV